MRRDLIPYNANKGLTTFDRSVRSIISYGDQALTYADTKYYAANVWGELKQIEADLILERELGLSPRRRKR